MPRTPREYAGAMDHVMSRGDRREDIFLDDVDRQDFLKTLAEACQKTDWQIHTYCLMLSINTIAGPMHLEKSNGANTNLHKWMRVRPPENPTEIRLGV